jgi:hypothetical protein
MAAYLRSEKEKTTFGNFRSSKGIVETARPFIEQNGEQRPKKMQPTDAPATLDPLKGAETTTPRGAVAR